MLKLKNSFCIFFATCILSCSVYNNSSAGTQSQFAATPIDTKLVEATRFLAGKPLSPSSALFQLTLDKRYIAYIDELKKSWARLQQKNLDEIEKWRKQNLPAKYNKTIFYPFSGPDILNAVAFFPDGNEYIMFGLEPCGEIPDPHSVAKERIFSGLWGLRTSLNEILNMNFFKTLDMQKNVSTNEFNSMISIIMWFLGQMNYEVINAKKIWIDDNSLITTSPPVMKQNKYISGTEIFFKDSSGYIKRVRYFQINVIDNSLSTYTNFIPHLESYPRYTTIIKSASYLMHNDNKFIKIRDLTLNHSDLILQDDSGVAFKFFSPYQWKFTFFGVYTKPVPLFAHRYQPELKEKFDTLSKGPLPFSYGYNSGIGKSNLMLAERVQ
ncbi:MAG: hypothetical protein N3F66_03385 [Spirochaetes bacterium]|nr:hypothetical protein [Spirochaetota bacterium]